MNRSSSAGHVYADDSDFCIHCGQSLLRVVDEQIECRIGPNVVAITHLIARRRMSKLMQKFMKRRPRKK